MGEYFNFLAPVTDHSIDFLVNKKKSAQSYASYMLMRLQEMFRYQNLPETIPQEFLEGYLMESGSCCIAKVNGDLYALVGSPGGEPDPYYRPTKYIVANPALRLSAEYQIDKDCVVMRNDFLWLGLMPLVYRYSSMLAENMLTIRVADIVLRAVAMLSAPDDKTKEAARIYLKDLADGKLGVIGENRFFDGVKMQSPPSNNGSYLTQFIELDQYLKGSFFQEIGIDALSNMKRESLSEGETHLNEGTLLPLVDHMLDIRQKDLVKVNQMFGTNIEVDFDSTWKIFHEELKLEIESMRKANELAQEDSSGKEEVIQDNAEIEGREDFRDDEEIIQEGQVSEDGNIAGNDSGGSEEHADEDSSDGNLPQAAQIDININIDANELAEEGDKDDSSGESMVDDDRLG